MLRGSMLSQASKHRYLLVCWIVGNFMVNTVLLSCSGCNLQLSSLSVLSRFFQVVSVDFCLA